MPKATTASASTQSSAARSGRQAKKDLGFLTLPRSRETRPVSVDEPLLTVARTVKLLSISSSAIYYLVDLGELPCRHVGGRIRFYKPDLEEYLATDAA